MFGIESQDKSTTYDWLCLGKKSYKGLRKLDERSTISNFITVT